MSPSNYPAAVSYVVNLIMAVVVSFDFMSPSTAKVVATAVVALTSLVVVFLVHPFALATATGAFQTFVVSLAGFGLHWDDARIASVVGVFTFIAAVVMHSLGTPLSAARAGTTGNERALKALRT